MRPALFLPALSPGLIAYYHNMNRSVNGFFAPGIVL